MSVFITINVLYKVSNRTIITQNYSPKEKHNDNIFFVLANTLHLFKIDFSGITWNIPHYLLWLVFNSKSDAPTNKQQILDN